MSGGQTVFEALLEAVAGAAAHNPDYEARPAAILWPDKQEEWLALVPRLREALPHFLTHGDYELATRTGPAIWTRCMIARMLPEADWPEDAIPIIYLPGLTMDNLRPSDETPWLLAPLVELQYRGVAWTQANKRDWTIAAFLGKGRGALGLDVARDAQTLDAMSRALLPLSETPVADLEGRRLEAGDFDELLNPDVVRQLLLWMNDPAGVRESWDDNSWQAFCSRCRERFSFDPETDGELVAGEQLGGQQGSWQTAWHRFVEAPARYGNVPELLRRARPEETGTLFFDKAAWPQDNEEAERELRESLLELGDSPAAEARDVIEDLEEQHGKRRQWIWADIGLSALAKALEHIALLASVTRQNVGGITPGDVARVYAEGMWQADAAALDALAAVTAPDDVAAVTAAINAVYRPWLEAAADHFQQAVKQGPLLKVEEGAHADVPRPGVCVLFADGLRFDVGHKLKAALEEDGMEVEIGWSFAALPTVTATAKPAVAPVALEWEACAATEFVPRLSDGRSLDSGCLRRLLGEQGYEVLDEDETGSPEGAAWTEYGRLDRLGHDEGWRLSRRVEDEVVGLTTRIRALLDAGWTQIQVVTDHGWLLLPGGLPKVELPAYLTETRWGRCAELKSTSSVEFLTVPWHWNPAVEVAMAPGIACFVAGREYAHGGLSLQECVVPRLMVSSAGVSDRQVSVEDIKWVGMRCRVQVTSGTGLKLDLRTRDADSSSTIINDPQVIDDNGEASVLVTDHNLEGTAVSVVVVDDEGNQFARALTTVGG